MRLRKIRKIFAIVAIVALVFSLVLPASAEDIPEESGVFDVNNISLKALGEFIETKDNKDRVKLTLEVKNNSDIDSTPLSLKASLSKESEFLKSEDSFEKDGDSIVLKDQSIKAQETKTYSYYLNVLKGEDNSMSWFIDDKEVEKIDSLDSILINKDKRDEAYKALENTEEKTQEEQKEEKTSETTKKKAKAKKITPRGVAQEGVFETDYTTWTSQATLSFDGKIFTATADWYAKINEGDHFVIEKIDKKAPYNLSHGKFTSGYGYIFKLLNASGEIINHGDLTITLKIEKADGLGLQDNDQILVSKNPVERPKEVTVDSTATKTDTSITITAIPTKGLPSEIYIGQYSETTDDTFESVVGPYSIGTILANYNVFLSGNFQKQHIIGPQIIGGTAISSGSLGGSSTTAPDYIPTVPSYYGKGYEGVLITGKTGMPMYFGNGVSKEKKHKIQGDTIVPGDQGSRIREEYYDYYFSDNFVDFTDAMSTIASEARSFSGQSMSSSISGGTLNLDIGGLYEFTAAELNQIDIINFIGDFGAGYDTFIICKDENANITLPKILSNGAEIESIETGMNGSLVFLLPDASTVQGNAISGHIVAPYANVTLTGGYFNGCVIANNLDSNAEGHMWNYNGKMLTPTSDGFVATKKVNGNTPTNTQNFTF